jgi:hypothetical protein
VSLINGFDPQSGYSFDILDWASVDDTFRALSLPELSGSLEWNTSQLETAGILSVGLPGDYNADEVVAAADYVVWRKNPSAIPNGYNTWRANFGASLGSGSTLTAAQQLSPAIPRAGKRITILIIRSHGSIDAPPWIHRPTYTAAKRAVNWSILSDL